MQVYFIYIKKGMEEKKESILYLGVDRRGWIFLIGGGGGNC